MDNRCDFLSLCVLLKKKIHRALDWKKLFSALRKKSFEGNNKNAHRFAFAKKLTKVYFFHYRGKITEHSSKDAERACPVIAPVVLSLDDIKGV